MELFTKEDLEKIVGDAVTDSMKREFKSFYIPPEKHYKQHEFIEKLMDICDDWNKTKRNVISRCILYFIVGLLFLGFLTWGIKTFNVPQIKG